MPYHYQEEREVLILTAAYFRANKWQLMVEAFNNTLKDFLSALMS